MTRRAKAPARVDLKPPVKVRELTQAELAEAARNVKALREHNASWKLGDKRDAENPCKQCGGERVEIMTDVTSREVRERRAMLGDPHLDIAWDVRCLTCNPMVH